MELLMSNNFLQILFSQPGIELATNEEIGMAVKLLSMIEKNICYFYETDETLDIKKPFVISSVEIINTYLNSHNVTLNVTFNVTLNVTLISNIGKNGHEKTQHHDNNGFTEKKLVPRWLKKFIESIVSDFNSNEFNKNGLMYFLFNQLRSSKNRQKQTEKATLQRKLNRMEKKKRIENSEESHAVESFYTNPVDTEYTSNIYINNIQNIRGDLSPLNPPLQTKQDSQMVIYQPAIFCESELVEPKKSKRGRQSKPKAPAKKQDEMSLADMLDGRESRTWIRFWKFCELWPREKNPKPKTTAALFVKALSQVKPQALYAAALEYSSKFQINTRGSDQSAYMIGVAEWLKNESWLNYNYILTEVETISEGE